MLTTEAAPGPEESGDKKEQKVKKRKRAKRETIDVGNNGQLNKDLAISNSEADSKTVTLGALSVMIPIPDADMPAVAAIVSL